MTIMHDVPDAVDLADGPRAPHEVSAGESALVTVLAHLQSERPDIVSAPLGLDVGATSVLLWDGSAGAGLERDAIVLAVGVTDTSDLSSLLAIAGRNGACAVVMKRPDHVDWLAAEAQRHRVALLSIPSSASWDRAYRAFASALAAVRTSGGPRSGLLTGDLFALADSAATLLGGAVEIDDVTLCPVAYSSTSAELDEVRRSSILTRRPPPAVVSALISAGQLNRIRSACTPVRVEVPGGGPRLVMPVRAGLDLLGYVWLLEGVTDLGEIPDGVLSDVARIASNLMVRLRSVNSDESLASDLLHGVLDGVGSTQVVAGYVDPGPHYLLSVRTSDDVVALHPQQRALLANAVALHCLAAGYGVVVTEADDSIYALLSGATHPVDRLEEVGRRITDHVARSLRVPLIVSISSRFEELEHLREARIETDRLANMLAKDGGLVGAADKLRPQVVLAELREMTQGRPHLMRGPLEVLAELDRARNTDYIPTLRVYLSAQCDPKEAGRILCLHRNTVRYRIARIQEMCRVDLHNPVERLVMELQLNLFEEEEIA